MKSETTRSMAVNQASRSKCLTQLWPGLTLKKKFRPSGRRWDCDDFFGFIVDVHLNAAVALHPRPAPASAADDNQVQIQSPLSYSNFRRSSGRSRIEPEHYRLRDRAFNFPFDSYTTERLSGDQKGSIAFSEPSSSFASVEFRPRT